VPTSKGEGREGMGKGKKGGGKREMEDGNGREGRGGRARHVCVPINKKNYHYTAAPLTRGSAPGPSGGFTLRPPHHSQEIAANDKSSPNRWYEVVGLIGGNVS